MLFGGSDGILYAADSCTLEIRWTADLDASLGDPIVANVDSDPEDEILVNAANGFLYGLDSSPYPQPIVTFSGSAMVDPHGTLQVAWTPVAGASHYELALTGPQDEAMWDPAYVSVTGTSALVNVDGALPGRPYHAEVPLELLDVVHDDERGGEEAHAVESGQVDGRFHSRVELEKLAGGLRRLLLMAASRP